MRALCFVCVFVCEQGASSGGSAAAAQRDALAEELQRLRETHALTSMKTVRSTSSARDRSMQQAHTF